VSWTYEKGGGGFGYHFFVTTDLVGF
jgi:hypothetical protein